NKFADRREQYCWAEGYGAVLVGAGNEQRDTARETCGRAERPAICGVQRWPGVDRHSGGLPVRLVLSAGPTWSMHGQSNERINRNQSKIHQGVVAATDRRRHSRRRHIRKRADIPTLPRDGRGAAGRKRNRTE